MGKYSVLAEKKRAMSVLEEKIPIMSHALSLLIKWSVIVQFLSGFLLYTRSSILRCFQAVSVLLRFLQ